MFLSQLPHALSHLSLAEFIFSGIIIMWSHNIGLVKARVGMEL